MEAKVEELVQSTWNSMMADCKTGSGGIFFDWQRLDATAIDTPSKVTLLGLIVDRYDKVLEKQKTADLSNLMRNIIPEKGQLIFLFDKIRSIPEINP